MLATQQVAHPTPVGDDGEVKDSFTDESAFDLDLACNESRTWMEAVLQEPIPGQDDKSLFRENLKDGQRLCRFINCIKPQSVKNINKMKVPFACFENLAYFTTACRQIGLKDTQLFVNTDLYGANEKVISGLKEEEIAASTLAAEKEEDRQLRDFCITIYWLGRAVREMADYKGPQLNLAAFVKLSCSRCQDKITDEQYITDGPRNFHTDCFKCDTCTKTPEANTDYKWDGYQDKLFCASCRCVKCKEGVHPGGFRSCPSAEDAAAKICPTCDRENQCHRCNDLLEDTENAVKDDKGKKHCPKCVCSDGDCNKPLVGDKYVSDDEGNKYCPDCACQRKECGKYTGKDPAVVDGHKYCPTTCVCQDKTCGKPFVNDKFKEVDGKRFCPDCVCQRPECDQIPGEAAKTVEGKKYCPTCVCADEDCGKPFVNDQFKEHDGKRYCPDCMCQRPECDAHPGASPAVVDGKKYCPTTCVCADASCGKPFVNDQFKEVEGKRYCPDCMCHRKGCDAPAGPDAITIDGEKYCPNCVCADDECAKPLVEGEFEKVAPGDCEALPKGGNVCRSCLCTLCSVYVGKNAHIKRKGARYCKACVCTGCKIGLTEAKLYVGEGQAGQSEDTRYCKACVCTDCHKGLSRRDTKHLLDGGAYCSDCVCGVCDSAFTGRRTRTDATFEKDGKSKTVCAKCVCSSCTKAVVPKEKTVHGGKSFCPDCVCAGCKKPENATFRGALTKQEDGKSLCSMCVCHECSTPVTAATSTKCVGFGDYNYCKDCVCDTCEHAVSKDEKVVKDNTTFCGDCVCLACEVPLGANKEETSKQWHSRNVCNSCACGVCDRPQTADKPHTVLDDGSKACDACLCDGCENVLKKGERTICASCSCNDCGVLLDDDEVDVCDGCGDGKENHVNRQSRRAERKASKEKAKAPPATTAPAKSAPPTSTPSQPIAKNNSANKGPNNTGNPLGSNANTNAPETADAVAKGRVCGRCDEALVKGGVVKALDKEWHKECFTCNGCKGDLAKGFMSHESQPYCANCHGKASGLPDCLGCHETVSGAYLSLGDKGSALNWHKSCFNCNQCSVALGDSTNFQVQDAKPVCAPCYAK